MSDHGRQSCPAGGKCLHQMILASGPASASVCICPRAGWDKASKRIDRTLHPPSSPVQDMCVDHRRSQALVTQQLLHRPDVVPATSKSWRRSAEECGRSQVWRDVALLDGPDGRFRPSSYLTTFWADRPEVPLDPAECRPFSRSSGSAPALTGSPVGEGRRLRGLSPKDACSSPRAGSCRLARPEQPGAPSASPLLLGKISSLSQRVSFLSQ